MAETQLAFGQSAMEELEGDFKNILNELAGEQSLDKFRVEYEKLHRALQVSYTNEKKLLFKVKDLNNNIVGNAAMVQTALKLTQQDSQTITVLKSELEKAYKVLEMSREREEKSKQKIENLLTEIKHLQAINEQGQSAQNYKNEKISELQNIKDKLKEETTQYITTLTTMKQELNSSITRLKSLEQEKLIKETQSKEEYKSLMEIDEKVKKDEDRKRKMQEELDSLRKSLSSVNMHLKKIEEDIEKFKGENESQMRQVEQKDKEREAIKEEIKIIRQNYNTMQKELTQKDFMKKDSELNRAILEQEIKDLSQKRTSMLLEINQAEKNCNKLENTKQQLIQQSEIVSKKTIVAVSSVNQLERQVHDTKNLSNEDRKLIEELKKAKETLDNGLRKTETTNKIKAEEILKYEREVFEKEREIFSKGKEVDKLDKRIQSLDKEKEKYGKQAAQANAKHFHALEEIKLKDNLISEFQKKNLETESKLKQQQTLYEAVRSDRNLYSKNLSETQDEIAEIKRRYKIVNHQIQQLKEEIDAKEVALAKEHFEHKKKDKTIEEHSRVLEKYKKDIEEKEEKIKNFVGEIGKLHFIIKDSEMSRTKLKEEYEVVVADRDILGTQLIRRNDESALLYEKIKIQQRTLANGESQYRERLGDIELLRYKIADLMRALKIYRKQVGDIPSLQDEIHNFQRELIQEKLKVKALAEELENPLNAHRCRKLEGSDPDVYEMKQKLQSLQRRLILKTEQVVEKEVLIQQKEKQIQELREIMKRQPGIEEAKKISTLQQSLKNRTRQMKALASELNMYQAQVNEYKYDIEKLNKDLQETKRRYYEQRKREQIQKEQGQYAGGQK